MDIETYLLAKVWQRAFDKMSDQEKRQFFLDFGIAYGRDPKALPFMSIQALIIGGGFAAYRLSVIIANAVAKQVVGRGLSLATNRALTRSIAAYAGPVGWAITTLWAAVDMAGPVYRITIPCVIHVGLIRRHKSMKFCPDSHASKADAKFCNECGKQLS
jgi:uncharacterized protein YaaW (UPF0174 family)